jgi:hypothetical protein
MQQKQRKQTPPNWGVMFSDGSVRHRWNGRTQLHRALRHLDQLKQEWPTENITLCYRKTPTSPWVRVVPNKTGAPQ